MSDLVKKIEEFENSFKKFSEELKTAIMKKEDGNYKELKTAIMKKEDGNYEKMAFTRNSKLYYQENNSKVFLLRKGVYKIPILLSETVKSFIINGKHYKNKYGFEDQYYCNGLRLEFPIDLEENFDFVCKYSGDGYDIHNLKVKNASIIIGGNEDHKYSLEDFLKSIKIGSNMEDKISLYYFFSEEINDYLKEYKQMMKES